MKKDIVIFNPITAKDLLKKGFHIKDIAEDRKVKNATVFYFEDNYYIREYLKKEWGYTSFLGK